ncbi:CdaR family transcriptional regulator [Micromonospora sp. ATCC 39149]|uniref:PucR family transcriptional regulator n=1 Tax=Micromonospora sp. (strain ATCC 39149 / NRRL 15099 / SCC 1413) TaxID=219305 RepID=UPI001E477333|nr:helix-turn-helix domain-containing protein [Micromonospora sp. ATCC 39149]
MTMPERAGVLGPLLRDLATDRRVVDEMVEAARVHSPEVARLPMAENRRHVAALLAAGLGVVRAAGGAKRAGLLGGETPRRRPGPRWASPSPACCAGCRPAGNGWSRSRSTVAGPPGFPTPRCWRPCWNSAGTPARWNAPWSTAITRPSWSWPGPGATPRNRLLRRLLLDEAGDGRPDDLAGFGLRPDGRYHCVVTGLTEPARISAVERQFCGGGAVFGTVDDRLAGLSARLPPAHLATAAGLVVAAPARPLTQAPTLYRLCVAALRAASRAGLRGLHQVVDLAGETALAAQPALAELVSGELLGALDSADEFHRQLVSTALTYLDHGQRLDRTAEALHLHPNTVRYRLRRLQELTGMPPTLAEPGGRWPVPQTLRWWWALRTWLDEG